MKTKLLHVMICLVAVLAIIIAPANASTEVNERTDISLSVFVPCALNGVGEIVDLSGPLHVLISSTINGNNVSGYFHFQPQGISGTGEASGTKYQGTGATKESFKISFQNGQASFTSVNNFRIIGQGPGDNFLVHETQHITINAEGTMTVSHDNFSIDCK